ncbi:MAG: SpoIIE family protein phosphatase [Phycisphaerales bacterium]|nr:SpoIIE family protein phosphatase [Phycisphaerales bacterium]
MSDSSSQTMKLILAKGPVQMDPIEFSSGETRVLGRSSSCEIPLDDAGASISRRHLEISMRDGEWAAIDLGSRNGTQLNGTKMTPDFPAVLNHGDVIRMGSWVFRVNTRLGSTVGVDTNMIQTMAETDDRTNLVERVNAEPLANLASHRLAVLLECADKIHSSKDMQNAAKIALHAMIESTGFSRAAYLVPQDEKGQYETVAFESKNPLDDVSSVNFSQSLLDSASEGEVVRLSASAPQADFGQSIAELEIHSALCVPVMVEDTAIGYMYLDARGSESTIKHDASAFGRAVGRLLGLTASNLRGKELEIEQHAMQYDLDAAAKAQRLLLPDENGVVGAVSYSMLMRPGRMVAGDLFGVIELDDGRVCAFLGDVSGKGAGAAIMMATTQSYIHAMFEQMSDLGTIMTRLNRHIANRSTGQFVTMWVGIIKPDPVRGSAEVEFVDAGHGHWMITQNGSDASRPNYVGSVVVGIDPDIEFTSETFELQQGQRMVLFSDGIVEQTAPDTDEEYGMERAGALLGKCNSHQDDVAKLLAGVLDFAQSDDLRDDTTIASVGLASS